jgi:glycine cleavage system H protein
VSELSVPEELRYTGEHEWVRRTSATTVRVGITDYAQKQLDDVVFVQLPEVGADFAAGDPFGEVESTKSVSDIYAPLAGRLVAVNEALESAPELVNSDPYGQGWLVELEVGQAADLDDALAETMDAASYREMTDD